MAARIRVSPFFHRDFGQAGQRRPKVDVIRSEGVFEDGQRFPESVVRPRVRADLQQRESVAAQRHREVMTVGTECRFLQRHN